MLSRAMWVAVAATVAWLSYALWATPSFQQCIDQQEKAERAKQIPEQPPEVPLSRLVYARIDTVCAWRTLYRFRDAVAVVATVFIAFFTFTLWRSTNTLSDEAIKASGIAARSADAATKAAEMTEKTVKEMRANARHELRAYVSVSLKQEPSKFSADRNHGLFVQIVPVLHNAGVTPTRLLTLAIEASWLNDALAKSGHFFTPDKMSFDQRISVQPRSSAEARPVEIQERQVLQNRESLYVWGMVRYNDIFLKYREWGSEFCFRVYAEKKGDVLALSFEPYGIHNRADDECDDLAPRA